MWHGCLKLDTSLFLCHRPPQPRRRARFACSPPHTSCIGSVCAGEDRDPPPRAPSSCIRSFVAGAGRCSPPRTPCIGSLCVVGGRDSPPRTPCIGFLCAGADRCSGPNTPCMCSFGADGGRCSIPRTPCICSFRADAGTLRTVSWPPRHPPQSFSQVSSFHLVLREFRRHLLLLEDSFLAF